MRPSAHGIFPSATMSSWKFNEQARILTSNSPGLGLGGSSSTNLRFSKPPGAPSLTSLIPFVAWTVLIFGIMPSFVLSRILFKLRQRGIHLIPRVRVRCPDIHLRVEPTRIIQARRSDRYDVRGRVGLAHNRRAAVRAKAPTGLAARLTR